MSWLGRNRNTINRAEASAIAHARLLLGGGIACAVFALISVQVIILSLSDTPQHNFYRQNHNSEPIRGRILDRNGRLLATSLPAYEFYADPSEVMNPAAASTALAPLLPQISEAVLLNKLTQNNRYAELAWKVSPASYAKLLEQGVVGVYGRKRMGRFYPQQAQAAHILGLVGKDGTGLQGIEAGFDATLAKGEDVHLSLDIEVQALLRQAIAEQITAFEAIGGAGVVLDITTGEILALVSLPDYDPNALPEASPHARFNRATRGVYELGSTFKILNTAMALDSGRFAAGDVIDVVSPLNIGRYTIEDFHPETHPLTVAEVMVVSSNKGSARIAAAMGVQTQQRYIRALGLMDRLDLGIPEAAEPLVPSHWKRTEVMTISYGHGLSVTPVHLAAAVATAVGDGVKVVPSLIKGGAKNIIVEEVFTPDTTAQIRAIMRRVVTHSRGTGKYADAPGYVVGGKTGTAEKHRAGGYNSDANIASFVGAFPLHAPRFVVMVMVDEPKGQEFSYGYATGGWVAAPAVGRFITAAAPLLSVAPVDETVPEIAASLAVPLPTLDEGDGRPPGEGEGRLPGRPPVRHPDAEVNYASY